MATNRVEFPSSEPVRDDTGSKPRREIRGLRILTFAVGLAAVFGTSFIQAIMILDASPSAARFRGIHEANAVLSWVWAVSAAMWLGNWIPRLSHRARVLMLRVAIALFVVSAVAGLGWGYLRYQTAPH